MAKRSNTQTLLWISAIGIAGYWLYYKMFGGEQEQIIEVASCPANEVPLLDINSAEVVADNLFAQMDHIGTNVDSIVNILSPYMYNICDLQLIWQAFGYRAYFLTGTPNPLHNWVFCASNSCDKNLGEWFVAELSDNELEEVRSIYQPTIYNF